MPEKNQEKSSDTVVLKANQYNALLDRLEELEAMVKDKPGDDSDKEYNYEGLVADGKDAGQEQGGLVDMNSLSNEELAYFIQEQLNNNIITPLAVSLERLRLDLGLDRLERSNPDSVEVQDKILDTIRENPTMSIEKAYKLVRAEHPIEKSEEKDRDQKEKEGEENPLRHLPARPDSEKAGIASSSTKDRPAETVREAAEETLDELGIE